MKVLVRDNNVDQAMRFLKKKMQREGLLREMKAKRYHEKPSERRIRELAEAVSRARKLARKKAQREGLLPMPKPKPKKPPRKNLFSQLDDSSASKPSVAKPSQHGPENPATGA